MSDRIAKSLPFRIRPIAIPETGRFSGTPASIMASEPPQTDAIDDEPFDSVMSPVMRIVKGNSSFVGSPDGSARHDSLPCPMSRRRGRPEDLRVGTGGVGAGRS